MIKRVLKICALVLLLAIVARISYVWWFISQPKRVLAHYVTNMVAEESWCDEYYIGDCSTAIDGFTFKFETCDTTKLDPATYSPNCGCYQWEKEIGDSFYTISICPSDSRAYYRIYFHSLLDILQ